MPGESKSRGDLPLEVDTWLTAVDICLNRIRQEAQSP